MRTTQRRAKPLPPDDRRREIIEAVIPLLLEKGSTLSTREIAEAAGIAEGTVFSVFPDKVSVIVEAIKATVDPESARVALAKIPGNVPVEEQLEQAADVLMERGERVGILVGVLRTLQTTGTHKLEDAHQYIKDSHASMLCSLAELFDRNPKEFKTTPARAAVVFWGLLFANAHSLMEDEDKLGAAAMVDIVLHGIVSRDSESVA